MKYLFVVNPKAGETDSEGKIRYEISLLPEKEDCEVYVTKGVGDSISYVSDWCEKNAPEEVRVIACGGDGTINEVFNGAVGHSNASVTCYPCGSGNDFMKTFGGAEKFLNISALIHAPVQKMDLMKVGDRYSDNVINFGFDTTVAITVNQDRDKYGHGSKNSYTKGILKALITSMKNEFTVIVDDVLLNVDGKAMLCTLANGQYVGGSFRCAPRASTDDGLIEVCIVKPVSRFKVVNLINTYTKGEHLDAPSFKDIILYKQAKKVEVIAPEGFAYSLDGEIIYQNHFIVEIVPGALDLAVPA